MNSAKSYLLFLEIEYNLNKNYQLKIHMSSKDLLLVCQI